MAKGTGWKMAEVAMTLSPEKALLEEVLRRAGLDASQSPFGWNWDWNGVALWARRSWDWYPPEHPREELINERAEVGRWQGGGTVAFTVETPDGDTVAICEWIETGGWRLDLEEAWAIYGIFNRTQLLQERLSRLPGRLLVRWAEWWPTNEELAAAATPRRRLGEEYADRVVQQLRDLGGEPPEDLPDDPWAAYEALLAAVAQREEEIKREQARQEAESRQARFREEVRAAGWYYGRLDGMNLPDGFTIIGSWSHGWRSNPNVLAVGPGLTVDGLAEVVKYLGGGEVEEHGRVVTIRANKPGVVIGRGGRVVKALQAALGKRIKVKEAK